MTRRNRRRWSHACLLSLALMGAQPGQAQSAPATPRTADREAPRVTLGTYDQGRAEWTGTVSDNVGVVRVEGFDGAASVGPARLAGGRWTLPWQPREGSETLRVVASDAAGNRSEARLTFRRLALQDEAPLAQPDLLLRLPTLPGAVTRYTLDGTAPTATSPVYQGPLVLRAPVGPAPLSAVRTTPVNAAAAWAWKAPQAPGRRATVVRAQVFQGTRPSGPGLTRTYLIGQTAPTLPVLSLATDPGHLFDPVRGIYVPGAAHDRTPTAPQGQTAVTPNYRQRGEAWERPVHVEWFEPNGQRTLGQNAGVRISGVNSAAYPQKSLRLYARKEYGTNTFGFAPFTGSRLNSFKRLTVRTSGQDMLWTKLKDCMLHAVVAQSDLRLDVQACRPAVMFLNGEYWGLHNLREQDDQHYLAARHGLKDDDIVILEGSGQLEEGEEADVRPYRALLDFVRAQDLSQPGPYAQVAAQIDIDNFIDYNVLQIYIGNADWPENNVKFWRVRGPQAGGASSPRDGRWRWIVYDLDHSLFEPETNHLTRALGTHPDHQISATRTLLLSKLMANADFRRRFQTRFEAVMARTLTPERLIAETDRLAALIAPEMPAHIQRWNYPANLAEWQKQVEILRYFVRERPAHMRQHLRAQFGTP